MPELNESEMIAMLKKSKRVLLLEPRYTRKYIPLGLAKIATFVKNNGGSVQFSRSGTENTKNYNLVCITSLFTYDSKAMLDIIDETHWWNGDVPVLVGGVFATLMKEFLLANRNVYLFAGYSQELDICVPDYSINWMLESQWNSFSFTFTSRGCPNNCPYCAVKKLEPERWINPMWKLHIGVNKPNAMVSDNNLSSSPEHLDNVIEFLLRQNKRVMFDNGFDCKYITDDMASKLGKLKFIHYGMRMSFDRIEEDGIFQRAAKELLEHGIPRDQLMAFCLFNFLDTPQEANYRLSECTRLGIRPYPQQFTPLNQLDRKHLYVGKHWTPTLARAFRHFWLMAGYYSKTTFEHWLKEQKKYSLTKEDWQAWEGEK